MKRKITQSFPLHNAVLAGDQEEVQNILQSGCSINSLNQVSQTSLILAAREGNFEMTAFLLNQEKIDVDLADDNGITALMAAAYENKEDITKLLLERGANPNLKDKDGWTALIFASCELNDEIIKILKEGGAEVDLQNLEGKTAQEIYNQTKEHLEAENQFKQRPSSFPKNTSSSAIPITEKTNLQTT
jgi:ankyrin repeat protein